MTAPPVLPREFLDRFGLSSARLIAETPIAHVWKVRLPGGRPSALKVYRQHGMGNERAGHAYLQAMLGEAAVDVIALTPRAALLEWLPGPSLGDLSRRGEDDAATANLVAVANRLHQRRIPDAERFPLLDDWFEALFSIRIGPECAPAARADLQRCQALARQLLATQSDLRPLHGDLHHDNIRQTARGYCAFDAKGVLGERTYELANAFRNPRGVPDLVRNPDRVRHLRQVWSAGFNVDPGRLMQWVTVKCALSIAWRSGPCVSDDPEFDLLSLFVDMALD